ncbi:hypothetical protein F2Q69_00052805 [Brassica cretica]|uniref:Uncharacterized protein n=1 Tax=Brassica cretica TaxID=69181 RepID=A0A8S9NB14_BRACR|nr:hypothetical protein F2Q69_00052805 [Brassica cretica]
MREISVRDSSLSEVFGGGAFGLTQPRICWGLLDAYWFGLLLIVCVCSAVWLSSSLSFSLVNLVAVWSLVEALQVCGEGVGGSNLQSSFSEQRHRRLLFPPRAAGLVSLGWASEFEM